MSKTSLIIGIIGLVVSIYSILGALFGLLAITFGTMGWRNHEPLGSLGVILGIINIVPLLAVMEVFFSIPVQVFIFSLVFIVLFAQSVERRIKGRRLYFHAWGWLALSISLLFLSLAIEPNIADTFSRSGGIAIIGKQPVPTGTPAPLSFWLSLGFLFLSILFLGRWSVVTTRPPRRTQPKK